ncbi:PilW family protein [Luteimonas sp. R10]|uniref:PilW family protein n=1 Tax=Luteimonas sp. R10 TaxID=3108176 RepID=UPI00308FC1D1|nr:PilW family protein [Luteimonas sp. R10]
MKRAIPSPSPRRMSGLTLIELMIALILGLLVVGAAIGIFLSNRQVYRATENLGYVQENVRIAFELMARDIREAGGNPCVNNLPIANVINDPGTRWWTDLQDWGAALRGYASSEAFPDRAFGTGPAERLSGTDAIQLISGDDTVVTISAHNAAGNTFTVNTTDHGFSAGDLLLACNSRQASIFQASSVAGVSVGHAASTGPGNCTTDLGLVAHGEDCSSRPPFTYAAPNSVMVRLHATRWYVANNPNERPALYQSRAAGNTVSNEEVVEGVTGMKLTYLLRDATSYVVASDPSIGSANWRDVVAVRVELTVESPDAVGVDGAPLERQLIHVVSLRNRNA